MRYATAWKMAWPELLQWVGCPGSGFDAIPTVQMIPTTALGMCELKYISE